MLAARVNQYLDSYLATPRLINDLNLDAIRLDQLSLSDPLLVEHHFMAQLQRFPTVASIAFASEQRDYVGIARHVHGADYVLSLHAHESGYKPGSYDLDLNGNLGKLRVFNPDYDPPSRPWYQSAVKAKQSTWSQIFVWNRESGVGLDQVTPVYTKDGDLLGVLDVSLVLDGIKSFLRNSPATANGSIFIVDDAGLLVASSTAQPTFSIANNSVSRLSALDVDESGIKSAAQSVTGRFGGWTTVAAGQPLHFDSRGQRYLMSVTPYQQSGLRWWVVVATPESDFLTGINHRFRQTQLLIVLALALAIAITSQVFRWITKPVLQLNRASKEIAAGNWSARVPVSRLAELRELGVSFNNMAAAAELRATQLAASEAAARQAEAQALQAKERLSNIIETSADIICTVDKDGHFLEISENCEAIWGWPRVALLGRTCFDLMLPEEREDARRSYELRTLGQPKNSVQNHYVRPDGKYVPMSWSITWIEKDQISHCIGRNMTEYNALATQAQHAQRLESLGQLTGGIAHDFNNLLQVILSTSELLAEKLEGDASLQPLAEETLSAARRGADLTGRLLSFARRQTLVAKSTDLSVLVSAMSGLLRRTLGPQVEIEISSSERLANAVVDAAQLENAILNLCINSRDAMPEGGRLTIALANARLEMDDLRADEGLAPGEYVSISVRDTGTGIAPDNLPRVFEPFFTTKPVGQGSGLGLSMVFGFARQSEGCIRISSRVGEGTTVTLYLPAAPAGESVGEATITVATIGGNERILLVEDDAMVRDQIARRLEVLGYGVAAAPDGHEALRLINGGDPFDLVITDVMMPGGLNGWQLGQRIRDIRPRIPVLFISGFSDDANEKDSSADAGFHLLRKPFGQRELDDSIRQALATRQDQA
jgi:PAS domain S-box-containing protein